MANMTTFHPVGTRWHPLPIMSGVGLMIGHIVLKCTGYLDMPWWAVITVPLAIDIAVNFGFVALVCVAEKISTMKHKKQSK